MPDLKPTPNHKIEFDPLWPVQRWIYVVNCATKTSGLNDGSSSDTGWLQSRTITGVSTITPPTGITLNAQSNTTTTITIDITPTTGQADYEIDMVTTLDTLETMPITVFISVRDNGTN